MAEKTRVRFAPSPTGYMHVGNLRTALYTFLIAKKNKGTFILRIEDTDQGRLVEGAVEVIYKTMKDCRLVHDEGPDIGGPVGPYIQTERRELYGRYAELLLEKGGAYRCFCEKSESEEDGGEFKKVENPCARLTKQESDAKAAAVTTRGGDPPGDRPDEHGAGEDGPARGAPYEPRPPTDPVEPELEFDGPPGGAAAA